VIYGTNIKKKIIVIKTHIHENTFIL